MVYPSFNRFCHRIKLIGSILLGEIEISKFSYFSMSAGGAGIRAGVPGDADGGRGLRVLPLQVCRVHRHLLLRGQEEVQPSLLPSRTFHRSDPRFVVDRVLLCEANGINRDSAA